MQSSDKINESILAKSMIESLISIQKGSESATHYHSFVIGTLEFIFWPNLIYPKKEHPIHDGRKRIDITYTNAAIHGFFYRIHTNHSISSNFVMVECKNYNHEIKNPEFDQLSGRFSTNRGKLGFLLFRDTDNYDELIMRCKDSAADGRGIIIPIGDNQIIEILNFIEKGDRKSIDKYLENIFLKINS